MIEPYIQPNGDVVLATMSDTDSRMMVIAVVEDEKIRHAYTRHEIDRIVRRTTELGR